MGSVSDYLAHRTNRPLAVVPEGQLGIRRIVVGLDRAEHDVWAREFCGAIASPLGAPVVAVHVHRPFRKRGSEPPDAWRAAAAAELEAATAPLRATGLPVETRLVEDRHAATALLEVATEVGADLIVIGSRTVSGYRLLRLGGATMQLLHHSDRPVIVVPPPDLDIVPLISNPPGTS